MSDNLSLADKARQFAIERHQDQTYGNNLPYEWHLEKVASLAERLGYPEPILAAAWLHDVVEDTPTSLDEVRALFGDKIADIVTSVTYTSEDKAANVDKIQKAKESTGAHVVKYCDSSVNYSASALSGAPNGMSQWTATVDRYGQYLEELRSELPTPEEVDRWLTSKTR